MKLRRSLRRYAALALLASFVSVSKAQEVPRTPPQASACPVSRLEAGAGTDIDIEKVARSLKIHFVNSVSMIAFPAHRLQAVYAISVVAGGAYPLTYAVEKIEGVPAPHGREFHATVPLDRWYAQRIEDVWSRAVAAANADANAKPDDTAKCMVVDGTLYVFSSNGMRAHLLEPNGGVPTQLLDIADSLRLVALESATTGSAMSSSLGRLQAQLDRIESDLQIHSSHRNKP